MNWTSISICSFYFRRRIFSFATVFSFFFIFFFFSRLYVIFFFFFLSLSFDRFPPVLILSLKCHALHSLNSLTLSGLVDLYWRCSICCCHFISLMMRRATFLLTHMHHILSTQRDVHIDSSASLTNNSTSNHAKHTHTHTYHNSHFDEMDMYNNEAWMSFNTYIRWTTINVSKRIKWKLNNLSNTSECIMLGKI